MWRQTVARVWRATPSAAFSTGAWLCARTPRNSAFRAQEAALSREIAELEEQLRLVKKRDEVAQLTAALPPLDDAALEQMYRELIEAPLDAPRALPERRVPLLERLAARLGVQKDETAHAPLPTSTPHAETISIARTDAHASTELAGRASSAPVLRGLLLARLAEHVAQPDAAALIPPEEWAALAASGARDGDDAHVERTLALASHCGVSLLPVYNRVMDVYATNGALERVLQLSAAMEQRTYGHVQS